MRRRGRAGVHAALRNLAVAEVADSLARRVAVGPGVRVGVRAGALLVDARWPTESPDAIHYPAGRVAQGNSERSRARRYGWMIP